MLVKWIALLRLLLSPTLPTGIWGWWRVFSVSAGWLSSIFYFYFFKSLTVPKKCEIYKEDSGFPLKLMMFDEAFKLDDWYWFLSMSLNFDQPPNNWKDKNLILVSPQESLQLCAPFFRPSRLVRELLPWL